MWLCGHLMPRAGRGPASILACSLAILAHLPFCALVVVKPPPPNDFSVSSPKIQIHVPPGYLLTRDSGLHLMQAPREKTVVVPSLAPGQELVSTTEETLPFFEEATNTSNVTTQLGQNAHLHCRVNDLKDKTVSWVRRKGESLQLITFGRRTYTNEARYSLDYEPPNDWRLLIRYANERDDGVYECQVSSHPPLVYSVFLTVVVPRVEIADNRGVLVHEKFYKRGSTIELSCKISRVPQPHGYVQWRHGDKTLNYDTTRGGISVKTEMKPGGAISRLFIANANKLDSGNYSCSLDEAALTTILVHVLNGEHADAMQYGGCNMLSCISAQVVIFCVTLHLLLRGISLR